MSRRPQSLNKSVFQHVERQTGDTTWNFKAADNTFCHMIQTVFSRDEKKKEWHRDLTLLSALQSFRASHSSVSQPLNSFSQNALTEHELEV